MILLVSGATSTVARADPQRIGVLFVPRDRNLPHLVPGRSWAVDNGAFLRFDAVAFVELLGRLRGVAGCRFVACPDVVGDAPATLRQFAMWAPMIRALGYPIALVAQDGLTVSMVPWSDIDALFIGGSTAFKLSAAADDLLAYASAWGKWRHVGRVNTRRRMQHFFGRCDSIDGSGFSRFPQRIALAERWSRELKVQARFSWSA
jgi:hypothetical protein